MGVGDDRGGGSGEDRSGGCRVRIGVGAVFRIGMRQVRIEVGDTKDRVGAGVIRGGGGLG